MTQTLPTTIEDANDYQQMARLLGQHTGGDQNNLPRLTVNRDHEDDDGNRLPAGEYFVEVPDVGKVFAKEVTFRPLLQRFQYRLWDQDAPSKGGGKGAYTKISVQQPSFQEEFPDTGGTLKCGRPAGKKSEWTAEQKAIGKDIKTSRIVYGLVSFTGKTAKGDTHEVVDMPVEYRTGGGNFNAFDEFVKTIEKQQILMPKVPVKLTTDRRKAGATTVYDVKVTFDLAQQVGITPDVMETIRKFLDHINLSNKQIYEKHNKAMRGAQEDAGDADLASDLVDGDDDGSDVD